MKKIIYSILLLIMLLSTSFAQHYRVGAGFTGGLPNSYADLGGGFDIFVEYKTESRFSFRTGGGFYLSKFNDKNFYMNDIGYQLYRLEGSLMYYPIDSEFEPYAGAGFGYYFVSHEDFNEIRTFTETHIPQELTSKIAYHVKAGFVYPLHNSIKLHFQGKYLFYGQSLIIQTEEFVNGETIEETIEEKINLDTIFITVGVVIRI